MKRITIGSRHPAIADDRAFFSMRPHRRFRARVLTPGEIGFPVNVALFGRDELGETREMNLVILERIRGGRMRYHFATSNDLQLNDDVQIEAFLRSRGVNPSQHRSAGTSR